MAETMGMGTFESKKRRVGPDINVTPLVDVVLVLLIIFMVLAPVVSAGFNVRLPPNDKKDEQLDQSNDPNQPLVLTIAENGEVEINSVNVADAELSDRLRRMFNARPDNVLYVNGADEAGYGLVLRAIDAARGGGAHPIVMLTKRLD